MSRKMSSLRFLFSMSLAILLLACGQSRAKPETAVLAAKGKALMPVVVANNASPAILAAASNLVSYLAQISGAEFAITNGPGDQGIVVGLPTQFVLPMRTGFGTGPFEREDYILQSGKKGVWLIGATDAAVQHAMWDLLYRLGHRQFFPGDTWEVIPKLDDVSVSVDTRETPAFYSRRIWYNWGMWGYNNEPYRQWCLKNRHIQGFQLNSGHSYENIIGSHQAEFAAHPEYLSLVGGKRMTGGDAKFCVSNPDLVKLVVEHAVAGVKANPGIDSLSMDPSDGDNWCECEPCQKMGSPSDRALTLANAVAEAINSPGRGHKYVGMYAYNRHCAPPSIKVHPKVIMSATTAFIRGGWSLDQIIEGWQAKGATLGIYDYFSVVDWDWNLPGAAKASRPAGVAGSIVDFYRKGARFYDCESGDAWGPYGLGYYVAARTMWSTNEAGSVDALTRDFIEKAFGPAKEPMTKFYDLINFDGSKRSASDLVGRMYRSLQEARTLAKDRPDVMKRLDDLVLYTHYVELYNRQANNGDPKARDEMVTYIYRIRERMMIHAYGLFARTVGQGAAHDPKFALKSDEPVTAAEIESLLAKGIEANQPVEMGFTSIAFTQDYVPAAPLKLPDVPVGKVPDVPQDSHTYYTWVDKAPADIKMKVTVQRVWNLRPHRISLFSPLDVKIGVVAESGIVKPDGTTYDVTLHTPYEGLHRVDLVDGGDFSRVAWPDDVCAMVPSGIDTPTVQSYFRGGWTLYFYVPKGTKVVGGWAQRVAQWAPRISGTLCDSEGKTVIDFGKTEDGWFNAPVAPGQDGKLWKFENTQGMRQLMTVPPCLALNGKQLMLPREVVEKDKPKE